MLSTEKALDNGRFQWRCPGTPSGQTHFTGVLSENGFGQTHFSGVLSAGH